MSKSSQKQREPTPQQRMAAEDQRMSNLAVELGAAGIAVLKESFGFTDEQTARWFDLMIARARAAREAGAAKEVARLKERAQP
jgi:hypothetical protein